MNHQRTFIEEILEKGVIRNKEAHEMTHKIDNKLRQYKIKNPEIKPAIILGKIFTGSILSNFIEENSEKEDDIKLFEAISYS